MRKLLWLLPVFFLLPMLASIASWWNWFFFGVALINPYTELHSLTTLAGMMLATFAAFIAAEANT